MDTTTREFLTEHGISESNVDSLTLFEGVPQPDSMDVFYDDQPCEAITLTAGQVMTLRGALRGQVMAWFGALQMDAEGLFEGPADYSFDQSLSTFMALENLLAEAWAACKAQDVEVPDNVPDDFTV